MPTGTAAFSEAEIEYLKDQPLARLATVGRDGCPHVTPVGAFYDPDAEAIVIGGINMAESKTFRDAQRRPGVAIVVDDLVAVDPWTPRGIEIRGHAETHTEGGDQVGERVGAGFPFSPAWILIRPRRILSWGIDTDSFELTARDVPGGEADG
jgi:pyridoxamine 5'-phosphate oxidase family protein